MKNATFKVFALIGLGIITGLTSCQEDDDTDPMALPKANSSNFLNSQVEVLGMVDLGTFTPPNTYEITGAFAPAAYNGQIRRIAQLQEIVDSSRNEPIYWDIREALPNPNRNQFASTDAQ